MPWEIKKDPISNIVELFYFGITTGQDLKESTSQCITIGSETGINRFLVDVSGIELEASLLDVHNLPDRQYEEERADPSNRIAITHSSTGKDNEMLNYFASVSRNRGWKVSTFSERTDAINWLALTS